MVNKDGYLNRSIGTITSSRFGNKSEGSQERSRLLNQAIDAIRKLDTDELKDIAPELQRKVKLKQ